ncbi:MAG: metallopeptidase family protein [Nocardioidaceae bacterium]
MAAEATPFSRTGLARDRRGRGARGPMVIAGPLNATPPRWRPSRRDDFDNLVMALVERHVTRWPAELAQVEFATQEVPPSPADWDESPDLLGCLMRDGEEKLARIVVFRRPIELRAKTRLERVALLNEVLVEHLAELMGRDPDEFDS